MMKRLLILICFCCALSLSAQQTYTIDGETLELKTEAQGEITLLWNTFEGKYRYFVQKGGEIEELINTRGNDNKFQEQYKSTLARLTQGSGLSTDKLKLTLFSIREFVDAYNKTQDPNYNAQNKRAKVETRLLLFGGITNHPFVENDNNTKNLQFGAEFEFVGKSVAPRHALMFQIKHATESDDFKFSSTQLGLGYRFRFINQEAFNVYASVIGATYSFTNSEQLFNDEIEERDGESFDAPFFFGVGADVRLTDNMFLTVVYDELFGVFIDNQGNFSTNISAGIKFVL